ncbi:hypothetical protein KIN20_013804 [Parelaphostrongylus tenuis]|uniref:Uncharacterized protein n=1 Tax=Parelaphostrongylus tenuis TaxID=148309 RepID=A0AAD5QL85_PARTN|nr:hypothetical protein KIN20_013804 [Parelaphostrongylus tenuis]
MGGKIGSSDLRQGSKIRDAVLHARISMKRLAGYAMLLTTIVGREQLPAQFLGISSVLQEDHQSGSPIFSRKAWKKDMTLGETLERGGPIGLLLHSIGKMEVLVVLAGVTRRSTRRQAIQVICIWWYVYICL